MTKTSTIQRLKKRPEYLAVARTGLKAVRPGLVVQFMPAEGAEGLPRVGLTVSGKTGGAVDRSRIKRRLRQVILDVVPEFGQSGATYVVIGRRKALTRDFTELKKDLKSALSSLHSKGLEKEEA